MPEKYPHYLSYLIRMWQVKAKRGWQWRGSLESPGSGVRRAFSNMDSLIIFLWEQTGYLERDRDENESDILSEDE